MITSLASRLKIVLITMLIALIIISSTASAQNFPDIESLIDRTISAQLKEHHIPGAAVTLVADGEIVFSKGYGFADISTQTPVDPQLTLFRTGSVGKLVTWTAVLQLVEQGKLDLDADINTYLDFTIPNRLLSNQPASPITLRHLLTHTAGFEDIKEGIFYLTPDKLRPLGEELRNNQPARVFQPWQVVAYSNYGAALAGYIVERVSGIPFADYVEQHIFAPLAMENSTFRQPLPARLAPDMARASRIIDNQLLEDDFMYIAIEPAGSMTATVTDMASFMLAHLQQQILLQPETFQLMHSPQYYPHPQVPGLTFGFVEGSYKGQRFLFHGGNTFTFNSGLYLLPRQNLGLYVTYSGGDYFAPTELFQAVMDYLYIPEQTPPLPQAATSSAVRAFSGEYHPNRRNFTTAESILTLMETLQISTDTNGYLLATYAGQTHRFNELSPGLYQNISPGLTQNPYGSFTTLYFDTANNTVTLFTDGKMSFSKAAWYKTSAFNVTALILSLLILIILPTIRILAALVRRRSKQPMSATEKAAHLTAIIFTLLAIIFLVGTIISSGENHPLYGVPLSFFGILPPWSRAIDIIPKLLLPASIVILAFTAISWKKRLFTTLSRLNYTLFTIAAITFTLILKNWNIL